MGSIGCFVCAPVVTFAGLSGAPTLESIDCLVSASIVHARCTTEWLFPQQLNNIDGWWNMAGTCFFLVFLERLPNSRPPPFIGDVSSNLACSHVFLGYSPLEQIEDSEAIVASSTWGWYKALRQFGFLIGFITLSNNNCIDLFPWSWTMPKCWSLKKVKTWKRYTTGLTYYRRASACMVSNRQCVHN